MKKQPTGRKTPRAAVNKLARKLASKGATKSSGGSLRAGKVRVEKATHGGFIAFGSPVQPVHRTEEQIAQAVASVL